MQYYFAHHLGSIHKVEASRKDAKLAKKKQQILCAFAPLREAKVNRTDFIDEHYLDYITVDLMPYESMTYTAILSRKLRRTQ